MYERKTGALVEVEVTPGVLNRAARQAFMQGQCYALAITTARRLDWDVVIVARNPDARPVPEDYVGEIAVNRVNFQPDDGSTRRTVPLDALVDSGLTPSLLHHAVAVSPHRDLLIDIIGMRPFSLADIASRRYFEQYYAQVDREELFDFLKDTGRPHLNFEVADSFAELLIEKAG